MKNGIISSCSTPVRSHTGAVIQIMWPGPGPGRYSLPPTVGFTSHDYTRFTSPAYSFHGKLSDTMFFKDSSPGPCYYVDPKLTRFGRHEAPAYSMLPRSKPAGRLQVSGPGPGLYSPENAPVPHQRRPPSYSMGTRTKARSVDPVPAPNRYTLPSLLGPRIPSKPSSASFSISGRTKAGGFSEDLAQTPGPGHYNSTEPGTYLRKGPAFSMLGRHSAAPNPFQTPGPGAHSPERAATHKARAPSFTMGIRHSEFLTPLIVEPSE
ncbi:outer dense fiber protein 3-like protein 2 [Rhinatrema bivittatum]|uniref:outer dense fiber protein 3-like protein 2 n=1 Tax=Rhinatrema bivittatum TaxID=194408 RepID=UPI00112B0EE0|nr:outer dense fiber protein 3-like protein 2 [Rhinatrema bivittatum]